MARQQTFVLYPESSELTTKQAAEVLGVSRPFLIRVLEAGQVPFRKVGRHRRVLMQDILADELVQCRSARHHGLRGNPSHLLFAYENQHLTRCGTTHL